MNDLIRREDAVSRISDLLMIELQGKRLPTWNEMYNAINGIPSAETVRKKGEWIKEKENDVLCHCSTCGYKVASALSNLFYNFCPNCGTDMRGKNGKA